MHNYKLECYGVMKVVVRHQLTHILYEQIPNYSLWYPYHHISSQLHRSGTGIPLYLYYQQHHLYDRLPFGFKLTLILNHAIIYLDKHIFCNNSSDYSYWSSPLTAAFHKALVLYHLPPSVTQFKKGIIIFRLPTRPRLKV